MAFANKTTADYITGVLPYPIVTIQEWCDAQWVADVDGALKTGLEKAKKAVARLEAIENPTFAVLQQLKMQTECVQIMEQELKDWILSCTRVHERFERRSYHGLARQGENRNRKGVVGFGRGGNSIGCLLSKNTGVL